MEVLKEILLQWLPLIGASVLIIRDILRTRAQNRADDTGSDVSISREGRKVAEAWKVRADAIQLEFDTYRAKSEQRFIVLESKLQDLIKENLELKEKLQAA